MGVGSQHLEVMLFLPNPNPTLQPRPFRGLWCHQVEAKLKDEKHSEVLGSRAVPEEHTSKVRVFLQV